MADLLEQITPEIKLDGDAPDPVEEEKQPQDTQTIEDTEDIIEPRVAHRPITLSYAGQEKEYVQKPLSYFKKMEFFGLLGRTIDRAMDGDNGLRVNSLFDSAPEDIGGMGNFADLDSVLGAVAKIASYSDDFLTESYLIWLGVPKHEKPWAKLALDEISDDEGQEILETFIDQNWVAIEGFFGERRRQVVARVQNRRKSQAT